MKPLWIILSIIFIDGLEIASVPNLSIVKKVGSWGLADIALTASQMENGLNAHGISFVDDFFFSFGADVIVDGLVHVDMMSSEVIGSSFF